jgi:hypothetical protein
MNEVILERVAYGHWEVTSRNFDTGRIRIALFGAFEKEIAERFAARMEMEDSK